MTSTSPSPETHEALILRAEALLKEITPGDWFAADMPPNGWTIFWKQDAPIAHMRWTDGLRPVVEKRLADEARFIAAAPQLVRDLLAALSRPSAGKKSEVQEQEEDTRVDRLNSFNGLPVTTAATKEPSPSLVGAVRAFNAITPEFAQTLMRRSDEERAKPFEMVGPVTYSAVPNEPVVRASQYDSLGRRHANFIVLEVSTGLDGAEMARRIATTLTAQEVTR